MKTRTYFAIVLSTIIICSCDVRNENRFEIVSDSKDTIFRIDKKTGEIGYIKNRTFSIIDETKSVADAKMPSIREPDPQWHWKYADSTAEEDDYPILILRDGFKVLRSTPEGDFVIGWKLYALNTSPTTNYTLKINMHFIDIDDFTIKIDASSELIKSEKIETLKGTVALTRGELFRLRNTTWYINIDQNWKNEKLKGDRYQRAAAILKKDCPSWYSNRTFRNCPASKLIFF